MNRALVVALLLLASTASAAPRRGPRALSWDGFRLGAAPPGASWQSDLLAVEFAGADEYAAAASPAADCSVADELTVCAWVRPSTLGSNQTLVAHGTWGTDAGWDVSLSIAGATGYVGARIAGAGADTWGTPTYSFRGSAVITAAEEWTHLCVVYDADGPEAVYANGLAHGTVTITGTDPGALRTLSTPLNLARVETPTPQYFGGRLDEVYTWCEALTPAEAACVYNDGVPADALNCANTMPVLALQMGDGDAFPTLSNRGAGADLTLANAELGDMREPVTGDVSMRSTTGPDLTQCAAPLTTLASNTTFVCDCQAGADADCVAGVDGAAGSAAAPWRTVGYALSQLNGAASQRTIAFCRGGVFTTAGGHAYNGLSLCGSGNPCVVADYDASWASGDEGRPRIEVTSATSKFIDGDPGGYGAYGFITFRNLTVSNTGGSGTDFAFQFLRDPTEVHLECLDLLHFAGGMNIAALANGYPSALTMRDSNLRDMNGQGWLGGCDDCAVERNSFVDVGSTGPGLAFNHVVYVGCAEGSSTTPCYADDMVIAHNFVQVWDGCSGFAVGGHGRGLRRLLIEGNLITATSTSSINGGCYGLTVDGNSGDSDYNRDIVIRGNRIESMGNVGLGVGACYDCLLESNVVEHSEVGGGNAIQIPTFVAAGGDLLTVRATVRDNTVILSTASGANGIYVGDEGRGHVVTGNVVYDTTGTNTCYSYPLAATAYATLDGNTAYGCATAVSATGTPPAAPTNGSTADPVFESLGAGDYRPAAGSPLLGAASTSSASAEDALNKHRVAGDRGAFEGAPTARTSSWMLAFDGVDQRATAAASVVPTTGQVSFSGWFWFSGSGTTFGGTQNEYLFGIGDKAQGAGSRQMALYIAPREGVLDQIAVVLSEDGDARVQYAFMSAPTMNAWHHLLWTIDLDTGAIGFFVDGASQTVNIAGGLSFPVTLHSSTADFVIGARGNAGFRAMRVDELGVYHAALTASDATSHYGGGLPLDLRFASSASNLAAFWRMGEGEPDATQVADQSGALDLVVENVTAFSTR